MTSKGGNKLNLASIKAAALEHWPQLGKGPVRVSVLVAGTLLGALTLGGVSFLGEKFAELMISDDGDTQDNEQTESSDLDQFVLTEANAHLDPIGFASLPDEKIAVVRFELNNPESEFRRPDTVLDLDPIMPDTFRGMIGDEERLSLMDGTLPFSACFRPSSEFYEDSFRFEVAQAIKNGYPYLDNHNYGSDFEDDWRFEFLELALGQRTSVDERKSAYREAENTRKRGSPPVGAAASFKLTLRNKSDEAVLVDKASFIEFANSGMVTGEGDAPATTFIGQPIIAQANAKIDLGGGLANAWYGPSEVASGAIEPNQVIPPGGFLIIDVVLNAPPAYENHIPFANVGWIRVSGPENVQATSVPLCVIHPITYLNFPEDDY